VLIVLPKLNQGSYDFHLYGKYNHEEYRAATKPSELPPLCVDKVVSKDAIIEIEGVTLLPNFELEDDFDFGYLMLLVDSQEEFDQVQHILEHYRSRVDNRFFISTNVGMAALAKL
jgi:hypothetical protein